MKIVTYILSLSGFRVQDLLPFEVKGIQVVWANSDSALIKGALSLSISSKIYS